jgi:hypothetical protein
MEGTVSCIYTMQELNIETRSRDYVTVDEVVFSPFRAKLCRVVPSRAPPHLASLVAKL